MKKGDVVELKISDLAFGGAGVAKMAMAEGGGELVIFVEKTVPSDKISARLTKIKKNFGEARLEKILTPSPDRIAGRCKHFGVCGGCTLQFLPYASQLRWKQKMVEDALRGIGGLREVHCEPILGCSEPWFYRNKMEYTFGNVIASGLSLRGGQGPTKQSSSELTLGLHPAKNFREVFQLEECFLESPHSVEIVRAVQAWTAEQKLTAYNPQKNEGLLRNLIVREGKNTGECMVNLVTNGRDFPLEQAFAEWLAAALPFVTSLYRTAVTVQRGHRTVIDEFHLGGTRVLNESMTVAGRTLHFEILPQAFFQTNTKQAEALYSKVLEFAKPQAETAVLDLFCGTGTIGMFLAKAGAKVTGIDLNESAIKNARENAEKNGIKNIEFFCEDVSVIASEAKQSRLDCFGASRLAMTLVTDPPRAGIAEKSLQKILELKIPRWIYVSCNPTTLARDLRTAVTAGYKIERIQPIDMFPHTYHIETVCSMLL